MESFRPLGRPPPQTRSKFTKDEDLQLCSLVQRFGLRCWDDIAKQLPNRTARQCRDRYTIYLQEPSISRPWSAEEDAIIVRQFSILGPKWVEIAKLMNNRKGIQVKNRWYRHLSKVGLTGDPKSESRPETDQATAQISTQETKAPDEPQVDWDKILWMADRPNEDPAGKPRRGIAMLPDWYF
jgi:hypothetical protein